MKIAQNINHISLSILYKTKKNLLDHFQNTKATHIKDMIA